MSELWVKHTPKSDSQTVGVDESIPSLQANNLAQDLLRFHWRIAGRGIVAPQNENRPTAVSFLYVHYAMGNNTALRAIENDVSICKLGWRYGLNRDQVTMANVGMHA